MGQTCKRCLYDIDIPNISFDDKGICNYCHVHAELDRQYPTGAEGGIRLSKLVSEIKEAGKNKPFDVVIGVSGGRDSSYLLHLACGLGLRPIAAHYDNGWDTDIAKNNIKKLIDKLEVPYFSYRVRQEEVDDLIRAFLFSHTQDAEAPTDLALVKVLFNVARQYGIKYILDGHSFRTEGMAPLGWSYMDGRYVKSVHAAEGNVPLGTYPSLTMWDQVWFAMCGIKRPRPLYHIDYNLEKVTSLLQKEYGWEWYGGHHLENTYTAFFDYYYRFNKLGYDGRVVELSALVRSGQMSRGEAIERLKQQSMDKYEEEKLLLEIKHRLRLSEKEFAFIMSKAIPKKTNKDWPTYRTYFRLMKPLFYLMMKTKRIPDSFYIKYVR